MDIRVKSEQKKVPRRTTTRDMYYGTSGGCGIFQNLYFESKILNLVQE